MANRLLGLSFSILAALAFACAIAIFLIDFRKRFDSRHDNHELRTLTSKDKTPNLLADENGRILLANPAALRVLGLRAEKSLVVALTHYAKSPVNLIFRLQQKARITGSAHEDIDGENGAIRVSAIHYQGETFLWRLDDLKYQKNDRFESNLPYIVVKNDDEILYVNKAMEGLVGTIPTQLSQLFADLPVRANDMNEMALAEQKAWFFVLVEPGHEEEKTYYFQRRSGSKVAPTDTHSVLEGLGVAMVKLSADGKVINSNRLARRLLGHPLKDDAQFADLIEGLGRSVRDWLVEAAVGRGLKKPEIVRATSPKEDVYLQITLNRITQHGQGDLVAVLHDATELKTLEAQFVQSQKMQAIGQLAGGIAHDFNNLLTAISGYCDLALLRHDSDDADYGDLMQISHNANRAASLVGQLLAFSRKQNLQPEVLDLRNTLSDLTYLLNRLLSEQVSLTLDHAEGLRPLRADRRQLEQVIMNLVVNARDAMPDGGVVHIETCDILLDSDLSRDRVVVPSGAFVAIKVKDSGTGMSSETMSKIFEPFYTTKRVGEGTGLGLSTVYGIVKQSGGYIFVDSTLGEGTVFTLYFPASLNAAEQIETNTVTNGPNVQLKGDGVIMLVEDEAPVRTFAARALRMGGYTVLEAEDAEDALMQLQDVDLQVDVFITDVIMPGMDGPTWVRKALKNRPDVKVVFVSGYAEDAFADHQSKIPNSVFLPKPFSLIELTSKVNSQIH